VHKDLKVLKVQLEPWDQRVIQETLDLKVELVQQVLMELKVKKDKQVHKAAKV
jgi:hypothetical protein